MSRTGWAVELNGVMFTACDDEPTTGCDTETVVIQGLDDTPDGLGLPGLRVEDITFFQRDGVKHFNDWYGPRMVTLRGTIGPGTCTCVDGTGCSCLSVREQLFAAGEAWGRTCCDTELVIYPPCDDPRFTNCDDNPIDGDVTLRVNLVTNPSVETVLAPWATVVNSTVTQDATQFWVGTKSVKMESVAAGAESSFGSDDGLDGFDVIEGLDYTASAYMLAPAVVRNVRLSIDWYDDAGVFLSATDGAVVVSSPAWQRITATATAPADAVYARLRPRLISPAAAAEVLFVDGFMLEQTATVGVYFDGDTTDVDPTPEVGEQQCLYGWTGADDVSTSTQACQTYVAGPCELTCQEHTLIGPYGIVGRPRVFDYKPLFRDEHIYEFVARFDAIDQLAYLLDACGTPGTSECVDLEPGAELSSLCYPVCYPACYTTNIGTEDGSVPVTEITVCGTERAFPTITLNPYLDTPVIQNLTTGEVLKFNGIIGDDDQPVVIYTQDMTAFQGDTSVTHLLEGSGSFSFPPGDYELRLLVSGTLQPDPELPNHTGTVSFCWRDATKMM